MPTLLSPRSIRLFTASLLAILFTTATAPPPAAATEVSGDLEVWHRIELSFRGPTLAETDTSPHPFLDYRLQCTFTAPSGAVFDVPGFFDTDGAGGTSGNVWKCRFSPGEQGKWSYAASFRTGPFVALSFAEDAGEPGYFDGEGATFVVADSKKSAPDFRARGRGRLQYAGAHYLRFAGSGKSWIKVGTNIPENFLGYTGFHNTPDAGHTFAEHARDWREGDPTWNGDAGKPIIGALNFLAARGANSIYFLPMNVGGDGDDTFPTLSRSDKTHYDARKLLEWEQVFTHCDRLGIFLHFQLAETEDPNEEYHDGGELGTERKLFYRELVARFGHHLGVEWDIGEENDYGTERRVEFSRHIAALDPYDHPIANHNRPNQLEDVFAPLLGSTKFTMTAFQGGTSVVELIPQWRRRSKAAGAPWVISFDEPQGIENDRNDESSGFPSGRKRFLWPALMAGAGGFEWYVREDGHGFDQRVNDFREIEPLLVWGRHARSFFDRLDLDSMEPHNELSNADAALVSPGNTYALYAREARALRVDLSAASGELEVVWFSPTSGEWQRGKRVDGGGNRDLGTPPFSGDVAAIVARTQASGCANDADCDDGDACNGRESCDDGECVSGEAPRCRDADECAVSYCDRAIGCVTETAEDGTACGDSLFCNGAETCRAGVCTASKVPCRSDADPCTLESCTEESGCASRPAPDGTPCDDRVDCTAGDACNGGACQGSDACAAGATCDRNSGDCVGGTSTPGLACVAAATAPSAIFLGAMSTCTEYAAGDDADDEADSISATLLFADSTENAKSGGSGDEARYTVDLPSAGVWWLWGRFYYPGRRDSNDANSFRVAVDGLPSAKFGNKKDMFRTWHWDGDGEAEYGTPAPLLVGTLAAGPHELVVEKREVLPEGTQPRLDVICLTRSAEQPDDDDVRALLSGRLQCESASDCADRNACTVDKCGPYTRTCRYRALDCDDDNPCTIDACDEVFGCVTLSEADGTKCDDGLECTIDDACRGNVCVGRDACPGSSACNRATGTCGS